MGAGIREMKRVLKPTRSEKRSQASPMSHCLRGSPPQDSSQMLSCSGSTPGFATRSPPRSSPEPDLEDVARYVDDLRIVLRLGSPERDLADIERETSTWLGSLLTDEPALMVSTEKTYAADFGVQGDRPTVRQGDRMRRDPKRCGPVDSILLAVKQSSRQFVVLCKRNGTTRSSQLTQLVGPCHQSQMSPTRPSHGSRRVDSDKPIGGCVRCSKTPVRRSVTLLMLVFGLEASWTMTQRVFAAGLIQTWVEDPSNIRLLRVALDMWPSASTVKRILDLLMPYVERANDDEAHQVARYCLAELLRAGATETGLVEDAEALPLRIDEYRDALQVVAEQIVEHEGTELPWYLRQQALLLLAARGSSP